MILLKKDEIKKKKEKKSKIQKKIYDSRLKKNVNFR